MHMFFVCLNQIFKPKTKGHIAPCPKPSKHRTHRPCRTPSVSKADGKYSFACHGWAGRARGGGSPDAERNFPTPGTEIRCNDAPRMPRVTGLALLALPTASLALHMALPQQTAARHVAIRRSRLPMCVEEREGMRPTDAADAADAEMPPPSEDDLSCTARVVTELIDANGEEGKGALPDRFMMAVRAIRGEFSPGDDMPDTELVEDALLSALTTWPASVRLRIVSQPLEADEADAFVRDVERLGATVDAGAVTVGVKVRGSRRSIDFTVDEVPDATNVAALRQALKSDARVQMVF